jgi:methionyl-tRNA formyltransferase
MRIIYAGTPNFAVPALQHLIDSKHEVVAVVTKADRPSGRGRKITISPVKKLAVEHNIPVLQPEKLKKPPFTEELRPFKPDLIIVAAYGKILPKEMLELPEYGCINIHASLLPAYRGAAPINRAIMNCERETGVTIMKMAETLDTGEILLKESVPILEDDDALSITNMLSMVGANLLMHTINEVERTGELKGTPQDESLASYASKISKEDCLLNWSKSFELVLCAIRGLSPAPGAFSIIRDKTFKILRAEPFFADVKIQNDLLSKKEFEAGSVVKLVKGAGPVVRAKDGLIVLTLVQPPGKRAMTGIDLMNGKYLKAGDKLR